MGARLVRSFLGPENGHRFGGVFFSVLSWFTNPTSKHKLSQSKNLDHENSGSTQAHIKASVGLQETKMTVTRSCTKRRFNHDPSRFLGRNSRRSGGNSLVSLIRKWFGCSFVWARLFGRFLFMFRSCSKFARWCWHLRGILGGECSRLLAPTGCIIFSRSTYTNVLGSIVIESCNLLLVL